MMGHNCLHYAVLLLLLTSAILVWVVWQLEAAPLCGYTSTTTTRTKVLLLAYSRSVQQARNLSTETSCRRNKM